MVEKTPDTDDSGIERRDILKGLGFGAMGLAGMGATSGGVAAAQQESAKDVVNVGFTPPGEDLEDDEIGAGSSGTPTLDPSTTDGTFDIVVMSSTGNPDTEMFIGTTWTVFSTDPQQVTQQVFDEGTASATTEKAMADTDGILHIRRNLNVRDLPSGEYVMVLSCIDYSGLAGAPSGPSPVTDGAMAGTYAEDFSPTTVAHGFNVP